MKKLLTALISCLFLAVGVVAVAAMMRSAPPPARAERTVPLQRVETETLVPEDYRIQIAAHGVVQPALQISLRPRVTGEIIDQNEKLVPGGLLNRGEELVRIDPTDYALAVVSQQEALTTARYQLSVEQGRQAVAAEEWALLGDSIPTTEEGRDLALRKPHLDNARAAVKGAESRLERAEIDLGRTRITAPFNAVVLKENADIGQVVSSNSELATLVATDYFWVQVSIPYRDLKSLGFPDAEGRGGSPAQVTLPGTGQVWQGRLVQLLTDLEEGGRMARVLVRVDDPLGLSRPETSLPLLLDAFVEVVFEGDTLEQVYAVPYTALREQGKADDETSTFRAELWLLAEDDTLVRREVDVAWKSEENLYISNGLKRGERLITSHVATPVTGMKLQSEANGPARISRLTTSDTVQAL